MTKNKKENEAELIELMKIARDNKKMQIIHMYSAYDLDSGRYDTPFFTLDEVRAKRHFLMQMMDDKTMMNKFKDRFNLLRIGYFILNDGSFISDHKIILRGQDVDK